MRLRDFAAVVDSVKRSSSAFSFCAMFLAASLVLAGLACFGAALAWFFAIVSLISFGIAAWFALYSHMRRPDWLRTERHDAVRRLLEVLEDGDMTSREQADVLERVILADQRLVPKRLVETAGSVAPEDANDDG